VAFGSLSFSWILTGDRYACWPTVARAGGAVPAAEAVAVGAAETDFRGAWMVRMDAAALTVDPAEVVRAERSPFRLIPRLSDI